MSTPQAGLRVLSGEVREDARVCIAAWAAMSVVSAIPFWLTPLPPLNDYPSHLARMYLITAIEQFPVLQRFYAVEWDLIPNLAVDIFVPALSMILPVEVAMAVFTFVSLLLLSSGVIAINWSLFGRASLAPLTAMLILFNRQLLWGFVGYLFTLGLAFWVFAGWVRSADRMSGRARGALFAGPALLLFIGHLHAFATYALLIAGYEISNALHRQESVAGAVRRLIPAALQFVVPGALFLFASPTRNRAAEIEFGSAISKITGVIDAFHAYNLWLDAATIGTVVILVIAGFLTRTLCIHRAMLLPIGVLALMYLVLPVTMMGSFAADRRLATSIYFVVAASTFWRFSGSRAATGAVAVLAGLFLIRTAVVADHWRDAGRVYSDLLREVDKLPVGARLAAAVAKPGKPFLEDPPVMFFASMAVVRRHAFVNTLFADAGHQPLRLLYRPSDVEAGRLPHIFYVNQQGPPSQWYAGDPFARIRLDEYDYFLLFNTRYFRSATPSGLEPVAGTPGFYSLLRKTPISAGGVASSAGSATPPAR